MSGLRSASRRNRCRGDRGSTDALGLAIMAPAAVALALVILMLSRDVDSRATAQSAAEAAAQAAAQERNIDDARAAAQRVGTAMLIDERTCSAPSVALGSEPFVAGGQISVTVSCTPSTTGLTPVTPQDRTAQTFVAFAVIDPFRGVDE